MLYDDVITLVKQGGSRSFIIPAKWLRENRLEDFGFRVHVIITDDRIQVYPLRSQWEKKHPSSKGGALMEIPDGATVELKEHDIEPPID